MVCRLLRNPVLHPVQVMIRKYQQFQAYVHDYSRLERTPVYIVAPWWQPPDINISSSKEKAIHLHNQHLAQNTALETLAYTDGSGINQKIGLACIILGERKAIK